MELLTAGDAWSESFLAKIMDCVTSLSYSVILNGVPTAFFSPQRGIRQGDQD